MKVFSASFSSLFFSPFLLTHSFSGLIDTDVYRKTFFKKFSTRQIVSTKYFASFLHLTSLFFPSFPHFFSFEVFVCTSFFLFFKTQEQWKKKIWRRYCSLFFRLEFFLLFSAFSRVTKWFKRLWLIRFWKRTSCPFFFSWIMI